MAWLETATWAERPDHSSVQSHLNAACPIEKLFMTLSLTTKWCNIWLMLSVSGSTVSLPWTRADNAQHEMSRYFKPCSLENWGEEMTIKWFILRPRCQVIISRPVLPSFAAVSQSAWNINRRNFSRLRSWTSNLLQNPRVFTTCPNKDNK